MRAIRLTFTVMLLALLALEVVFFVKVARGDTYTVVTNNGATVTNCTVNGNMVYCN